MASPAPHVARAGTFKTCWWNIFSSRVKPEAMERLQAPLTLTIIFQFSCVRKRKSRKRGENWSSADKSSETTALLGLHTVRLSPDRGGFACPKLSPSPKAPMGSCVAIPTSEPGAGDAAAPYLDSRESLTLGSPFDLQPKSQL